MAVRGEPNAFAHVSPALADWHGRFTKALTSRDAAEYLAFLAQDCVVQVNNAMPTYSKVAMDKAYRAYLQLFQSLDLEILTLHGADNALAVEAMLNYTLNDGAKEVVQCAYFLTLAPDGLISSIRVYGNASRVFKPFIRATG